MIIRELLKCLGWEITSPVLQVLDNCATASQVANVLDNFSIELVYQQSSIPGAEQFGIGRGTVPHVLV